MAEAVPVADASEQHPNNEGSEGSDGHGADEESHGSRTKRLQKGGKTVVGRRRCSIAWEERQATACGALRFPPPRVLNPPYAFSSLLRCYTSLRNAAAQQKPPPSY